MSLDKWLVPKKSKTSPAGKTLTADNFRPEGIEPVNVFMREVCQNILDARTKDIAGNLKPAVVNFKILKEGQDLDVGVINKYMGKLDPFIEASDLNDVYKTMCSKFNEEFDNKYLFDFRLVRVVNQEPAQFLNIEDKDTQETVIQKFEDKINTILESKYYNDNKNELSNELIIPQRTLELIKSAAEAS